MRDTTRRDYEGNITRHLKPYFGNRTIRQITPDQIERFRAELDKSVGLRTVNKCLTLLSMMFNYALRHRWVSANPATMVKKLRQPVKRSDRGQHAHAGGDRQTARRSRSSLAAHHQDCHPHGIA